MRTEKEIEDMLEEMTQSEKYYELAGVELTPEDAERVFGYIEEDGKTRDEAIGIVLEEIRDVLSEGWEF